MSTIKNLEEAKPIQASTLEFESITEDSVNLNIFIELMEKYNTIKDICPFLEKDFKDIIILKIN